jgi:hypothetical protein
MYNTNAPLGLKPVDYQTGGMYTGKSNRYRIASGYSTAIGQFDPVVTLSDGTIGIGVAGAACLGVLDYVEYFTSAGLYTKAPNWTASTSVKSGTTAYAYVFDDPALVMDVQETDGSSGAGTALALADCGLNINFVIGAPNALGISTTSLNNTTEQTTSTLNLKLLALSNYPGNAVGNYANWLVTWNNHQLRSVGTTGV